MWLWIWTVRQGPLLYSGDSSCCRLSNKGCPLVLSGTGDVLSSLPPALSQIPSLQEVQPYTLSFVFCGPGRETEDKYTSGLQGARDLDIFFRTASTADLTAPCGSPCVGVSRLPLCLEKCLPDSGHRQPKPNWDLQDRPAYWGH